MLEFTVMCCKSIDSIVEQIYEEYNISRSIIVCDSKQIESMVSTFEKRLHSVAIFENIELLKTGAKRMAVLSPEQLLQLEMDHISNVNVMILNNQCNSTIAEIRNILWNYKDRMEPFYFIAIKIRDATV